MSQLVTIYGGSGFVGRYIARRLAKQGYRVRVAVRRPNEALFVKPYGAVGQVEPVLCNIRNEASVAAVMEGADAVVNCVGTFEKRGKNNFDAVQHEGAERIARIAAEKGVSKMVHISAIGADLGSDCVYSQTKAMGEEGILASMTNAVILRPSVIFGMEDDFFNRFGAMASISPIIPLFGGATNFQPVYVDDVAAAAVKGVTGEAVPGIYELGGPDQETFTGLMNLMLDVVQRRRLVLNLPLFAGRIMGALGDLANMISFGLLPTPITLDQARSLAKDNVVTGVFPGLSDLGIQPTAMKAILPDYLWRFRPSGQYAEIKDSAKNLKA